ncbi:MAG: hypothetical protein KGM43_14305 [Planctomycetota bacterium]|nr:hypothetical protein [Planctomycetota bacterium]
MRINNLVLFPASPEALICAIVRERGLIFGLLSVMFLCLAGDEPARGGERPSPHIVLVLVDIFPTACKLAGAALSANTAGDGEDRSPELLGTPRTERSWPLFWEYDRNDTSFDDPTGRNCVRGGGRSPNLAVHDGRWKLLVNADGTGAELYDLSADPAESKDLAANRPQQRTRLTKLVSDWRESLQ